MEEELEAIEDELDHEYSKKKLKEETLAIAKLKKDPKYFNNYAKKSSKSPYQIGPFLEKNGNIVTESFEKAEKLREQYENVYSEPDKNWVIPDIDLFFSIPRMEQDQPEKEQGATPVTPSVTSRPVVTSSPVSPVVTSLSSNPVVTAVTSCHEEDIEQATPPPELPRQKSQELDGVFLTSQMSL